MPDKKQSTLAEELRARMGLIESICLWLVMLLAAWMRLNILRLSPGWYHDETIYVGEAWNLMHGRWQWDAVWHTFLPRLPLFHLLCGPLLLAFGKDIYWVRLIAALSGIGMTWFIYRMARDAAGFAAALAGAFCFAVSAYTLLLTRWGMSYALDAFLGAANLYALIAYADNRRKKYLWLAIGAAGLGMFSDPVMGSRLLALAVVVLVVGGWRKALGAALASLVPVAAYVAFMLAFNRGIFLEDVHVILQNRLVGGSDWFSLGLAFLDLLGSYGIAGYLGLIGLLFLRDERKRRVMLVVFLIDLLAVLKLSVDNSNLAFRMGIILAPPLFVGLGALLAEVWRRLGLLFSRELEVGAGFVASHYSKMWAESFRRVGHPLCTFGRYLALICLAQFLISQGVRDIDSSFRLVLPRHYQLTVVNEIFTAEEACAWLRERLQPNDLVITTHVEWMLPCRVASPMLVNLADGGKGNDIYFAGLKQRFVYPCRLEDAHYFIMHDAMPRLASIYHFEPLILQIEHQWKRIYRDDLIKIYENPKFSTERTVQNSGNYP